MTSGCPQSQVLFFIFFVGDHIQDGVVDNDNDYHDDKENLQAGERPRLEALPAMFSSRSPSR